VWTAEVDVSNPAIAADWLRVEAGRGRLAGLFRRVDTVVHTPREGEDGYVPVGGDNDQDGPAQVRPVNDSTLASRITYTYGVFRFVKRDQDWEAKPALFPRSAARTALDVPDMLPNLRPLRGVVHSPVFRPDGSLVFAPGYDPETGLLHLPEPGLEVPRVPEQPTASDVRDAVKLLLEMIDGFPFVSPHFRANYLGALITPLLRAMAPPPYKLHAIEAHQPGSGKTLLANLARFIHGGVFRAELPEDDAELRKQITSILSVTTGPVVVLDNVSGALKSSTLAGLLTSDQWDDRPLGSTAWTRSVNDRLWTVTGNNLNLGGDLPRRTVRTVIDPGRPNPELRTGFAINDLERWVKDRRGELLHALLVVVRAWVAGGRPTAPERASDGYARWVRTVEGILSHAGVDGGFDHPSTQVEVGTDDDEWGRGRLKIRRCCRGSLLILHGPTDALVRLHPGHRRQLHPMRLADPRRPRRRTHRPHRRLPHCPGAGIRRTPRRAAHIHVRAESAHLPRRRPHSQQPARRPYPSRTQMPEENNMSASKRKGTTWESAIVQFLRDNGVPHAERRALGGAKDRGDIAGIPGVAIEAKSAARIDLAGWIDEAEAERVNDGADVGVVWIKRRGKTSPGAGFVILTGDQLVQLLAAAGYIEQPPAGDAE
jgi:hypothetical protein